MKNKISEITKEIVKLDTTIPDYIKLSGLYNVYAELFFSLQHFKKEFPSYKIDYHLSQSLKRICKHLQSINCLSSEVDMYIKSFYSLFFIVDPNVAQAMLTKQYEIHLEPQEFKENSLNTQPQEYNENSLNIQQINPEDYSDKILIVEHYQNSNSHRITIVNPEQAINYIRPFIRVIVNQDIVEPVTQRIIQYFQPVMNYVYSGFNEMKSEIHQVRNSTEEVNNHLLRQEKEKKIRQKSKVVHKISKYLFAVFIPFIVIQCSSTENIQKTIKDLWDYLKELVISFIQSIQDSSWMNNQSFFNKMLFYPVIVCVVTMNFSKILQMILAFFTAYFFYCLPVLAVVLQFYFRSMAICISVCLLVLWAIFYFWGGK